MIAFALSGYPMVLKEYYCFAENMLLVVHQVID
jgi:hypothetical protein